MTREQARVFLSEHLCGCGDPEAALGTLVKILELFYDEEARYNKPAYIELPKLITDEGAQYLLLYWLDHIGLLEHGGTVMAGWLTNEGKDLLEALRRETADNFKAFNAMYCIHGMDVTERCPNCAQGG